MRTACLPLAALAVLSLAPLTRAQERGAPAPQRAGAPAQRAGEPADRGRDPATAPEGGQPAAQPAGRMANTEAWRRFLLKSRAATRGAQPAEATGRPVRARSAPPTDGAERQLPSRAERLAAAASRAPAGSESARPARNPRADLSDAHRVPAGSQTVGGRGPTTLQHGAPLRAALEPRAPAAPAPDPAAAAAPAADAPAEAPASPAPSDAGGSPR